jgi:hypothetical protein
MLEFKFLDLDNGPEPGCLGGLDFDSNTIVPIQLNAMGRCSKA